MPRIRLLRLWEFLVIAATLIFGFIITFRMALRLGWHGTWPWVNLGVTIIFICDAFVQWRLWEHRQREKSLMGKLRAHRAEPMLFAIDIMAAIPFSFLLGTGLIGISLIRLVKFARVQVILNDWKRVIAINPGILRMCNFVFWMAVLAHWVACGWIALDGVSHNTTVTKEYLDGLYWCITTLTTVGYGDIVPDNEVQQVYTMIMMIIGVASYGFVIGNVASLLSHIDIARSQFLEKLERIDAYLRYRSVPLDVRERVKSYYQYLWESRSVNDEQVLGDMIDSLKVEVLLQINRSLIEKVPMFRNADTNFLSDIVQVLEPCVFLPNDYIFRTGETGDSMYFLSQGQVEVLSKDGERLSVLSEGDYFGEIALLRETRRNACIRALDYCSAYELKRDAFTHLLENYPEFARHLNEEALQRSGGDQKPETRNEEE